MTSTIALPFYLDRLTGRFAYVEVKRPFVQLWVSSNDMRKSLYLCCEIQYTSKSPQISQEGLDSCLQAKVMHLAVKAIEHGIPATSHIPCAGQRLEFQRPGTFHIARDRTGQLLLGHTMMLWDTALTELVNLRSTFVRRLVEITTPDPQSIPTVIIHDDPCPGLCPDPFSWTYIFWLIVISQ